MFQRNSESLVVKVSLYSSHQGQWQKRKHLSSFTSWRQCSQNWPNRPNSLACGLWTGWICVSGLYPTNSKNFVKVLSNDMTWSCIHWNIPSVWPWSSGQWNFESEPLAPDPPHAQGRPLVADATLKPPSPRNSAKYQLVPTPSSTDLKLKPPCLLGKSLHFDQSSTTCLGVEAPLCFFCSLY